MTIHIIIDIHSWTCIREPLRLFYSNFVISKIHKNIMREGSHYYTTTLHCFFKRVNMWYIIQSLGCLDLWFW